MRWGRGILVCLFVAAAALVGARTGLGGIDDSGVPVAAQPAAEPLFGGVQLAPGQVVVRQTQIANEGTATGWFSLTVHARGRLADVLNVTVSDTAGQVLYGGSLAAACKVSVGVLEPGESRGLRLAVQLPAERALEAAGLMAGASFSWTATPV